MRILGKLIIVTFVALIVFPAAHVIRTARFTHAAYRQYLTSPEAIMNQNDTGLLLYDRYGKLFFTFYEAKTKQFVPLARISPNLIHAVVAVEDKHFLSHYGFSPQGIIRSALFNLQLGELSHGGSTVTQQLVKNSLLTPRKSFTRKFQELVLAVAIEHRYSKAQILEMYLNSAYFGQGAFGAEQAAQTYFNKSAADLTLGEASTLAALLPAPSELSHDQPRRRQRQQLVLQAMVDQGRVPYQLAQDAFRDPLPLAVEHKDINTTAAHFALFVKDELVRQFGEQEVAHSGMRVTTSIDLAWQTLAQEAVRTGVETARPRGASNGAAVVIDPSTGEVLAMVGSIDWHHELFGKINMATSPRQPGSSFKPIVYAAAFDNNVITPATLLHDAPTTFGRDYRPHNYDNRYSGPLLARHALARSLNIPAVEVLSKVGVPDLVTVAKKLGITTLDDAGSHNLALALGAGEVSLLEMTSAYGALANSGQHLPPNAILEIKNKENKVTYTADPTPRQAVTAPAAFLISSILSDTKAREPVFGTALNLDRPAAVKTGTTQSWRDAWTVGYTPNLAVGVWVGNTDNTPMHNAPGAVVAAPIWKSIMQRLIPQRPAVAFEPPSSVIAMSVCRHNGLAYDRPGPLATQEYFIYGTEPRGKCRPPRPQATPEPPAPLAPPVLAAPVPPADQQDPEQ